MYVDDSGTPRLDDTPFYVIAGVIININDLFTIEKELELFRKKYFHSKYKKEEIHVHEIYHSRGKFSELTLPDKYNILNGLYSTVSSLPFTIIAVGIQKEAMNNQFPDWDIFNAAWTFLVERFDHFLCDKGVNEYGTMIIDESENFMESTTIIVLKRLFLHKTKYCRFKRVNKAFSIFPSYSHYGLQLADVSSYCTLKTLNVCDKFRPYWQIIKGKIRNKNGNILGYGFKVFPNLMNNKSEVI